MDSDQSEELFSDDDTEENVKKSSIEIPEVDFHSSFNTFSHLFNEYSPSQQKDPNCAEIPTTPLSLIPHISKAQLWTSDLETPNTQGEKRLKTPNEIDCMSQKNPVSSPIVLRAIKTPVAIDSPSSDEIIPGSQEISKKKRRKRPSRRILSNISNSFSDDDLHQCKRSQGSHNDDSDGSNNKLSPIKEYSIEESFEEPGKRRSKGKKTFKTITPGERIRQLRELKKTQCKQEKINIIDMPESEFVKDFKALEYNDRFDNHFRKKNVKNFSDQTGFVSFTRIIQHENELDLDKTIQCDFEDTIDIKMEEFEENENFRGFSVYSQNNSELIRTKHNNFLVDKSHDYFCSTEHWKILEGFSQDEIEQSTTIAARYKVFYNNYLNDNFSLSKRKVLEFIYPHQKSVTYVLPPIKMSLKSWWNTASGKELFVNVNAVHQSESWLLNDDFEKHDIEELLLTQTQENIDNKSDDCVKNDQKCFVTKINPVQDRLQQNIENVVNVMLDNLINLEIQEIMSNYNDVNSKRNIDNQIISHESAPTIVVETHEKDSNVMNGSKSSQSTPLNRNMSNENVFNNFCKPGTVKIHATVDVQSDTKIQNNKITLNNKFVQPACRQQMPIIPKINNVNMIDRKSINSTEQILIENVYEYKENESLESISMIPMMMGFQTGSGKQIKVPEHALLKASKNLADENLNLSSNNELKTEDHGAKLLKSYKEKLNSSKTKINHNEVHSRNRNSFKKPVFMTKNIPENEKNKSLNASISPMLVGFQTGNNKTMKVSDDILSKGKSIFTAEDLSFEKFPMDLTGIHNYSTPEDATKVPPLTGFTTGHGASIKISNNALSAAKAGFSKDLMEEVSLEDLKMQNRSKNIPQVSTASSSLLSIENFKKRKHLNDDETPAGRKKARIGLDLQKRKLFEGIEEEDEIIMEAAMNIEDFNIESDRNFSDKNFQAEKTVNDPETSCLNSSIGVTEEVRDSIAAFLKEETNFDEIEDKWIDNGDNCSSRKLPRSRTSVGCFSYPTEQDDKINERKLAKRPRSYPGSSEPINITVNVSMPASKSPKHDSIPDELFYETQFSQVISIPSEEQLQELRSAAVLEQKNVILCKKRSKVKPITGSWLHNKQTNTQTSLKDYFNASSTSTSDSTDLEGRIDNSIMSIDCSTAENYQFNLTNFFGQEYIINNGCKVLVGDGAILIPDEKNLAGFNEFEQSFLASPGVDPSLLPNGWIKNHYKWIVWKLASMERLRVLKKVPGKFLTPDRVMKQLKYRYDREIDRSQRSVLRRILEKDDAPSRRMILCVSKVPQDNLGLDIKSRTIELTDGWYSVPTITDFAMQTFINSGKIKEGSKLVIFGAELINHDEGRYPLDISSDVRLKIHTNSTRRARWYAKLGYQQQCGPIKTTLNAVKSTGGLIGKLTVAIDRVYPLLFREKTADGDSIIRNARCEEKAAIAFEKEYQSRIESIYIKAQQSKESTSEIENRVRQNLPNRRNVIPILKIKVVDRNHCATLSVWSCDEDTQDIFKENTCITIYNVSVSGKMLDELQLTAGRSTSFEFAPLNCRIIGRPRVFTSLEETALSGFNPIYREFDTVGIVVSIGPAPHAMKSFETVNIAFKKGDNEDSPSFYLSILFWKGVSSFGFTEIATVGSFIACINLEWRKNAYKSIPTAFCTERTLLTRNPRQSYLREEFDALCARIKDTSAYIESCATIIQTEIDKKSCKVTPGSRNSINANSDHRRSSNSWTPEHRDFCLVNPDSVPRIVAQKVATMNRLEKLSHYGDAPELSPIYLSQTPRVALNFQSPVAQLSKSSNS